jgi:hypothetical protein
MNRMTRVHSPIVEGTAAAAAAAAAPDPHITIDTTIILKGEHAPVTSQAIDTATLL